MVKTATRIIICTLAAIAAGVCVMISTADILGSAAPYAGFATWSAAIFTAALAWR
jgi:hypothetical protein